MTALDVLVSEEWLPDKMNALKEKLVMERLIAGGDRLHSFGI